MKWILTLFLALVSCGCERIKETPPVIPKMTFVLHDRSVSVGYGSEHISAFTNHLIEERMTTPEDVLYRVPVGESGFDLTQLTAYQLGVQKMKDTDLGELVQIRSRQQYQRNVQDAQRKLTERLRTIFTQSGTDQKTQLLATLASVQKIQNQYPNHETVLVILSDLVEDSDLRSLYKGGFSSAQQARKAAQEDAVKLSEVYGLVPHVFEGLQKVSVVFPQCGEYENAQTTDSGFLVDYMQEVFLQFGCSSFEISHHCP